jgi:hypothetical protein
VTDVTADSEKCKSTNQKNGASRTFSGVIHFPPTNLGSPRCPAFAAERFFCACALRPQLHRAENPAPNTDCPLIPALGSLG